uniref:Uncharacterized protein n=1 Tax=Arundo donax TaxID=35708 RepID=A0A0A9AZT2_ARUDO
MCPRVWRAIQVPWNCGKVGDYPS